MSFKAKDLTYDNSQPAFLRRLRGELAGDDSGRHEKPIPRNKRMQKDDEDDAPTYVLEESGDALSKEEYEALMSGKDSEKKDEEGPESRADDGKTADQASSKPRTTEASKASKKRKAIKVIGEDEEGDDRKPKAAEATATKKPKKKAKPIKLSFEGQEEG